MMCVDGCSLMLILNTLSSLLCYRAILLHNLFILMFSMLFNVAHNNDYVNLILNNRSRYISIEYSFLCRLLRLTNNFRLLCSQVGLGLKTLDGGINEVAYVFIHSSNIHSFIHYENIKIAKIISETTQSTLLHSM